MTEATTTLTRAAVGRYNLGMDLHAEQDRLNTDSELPEWVAGTVQKLLDKARQDAATIKAANLKIQALTLEHVRS